MVSSTVAEADNPALRYQTLQAGLDLIDQGITVIDAQLRIVAWNRAFMEMLEFPPEMAFVGATFESFMRYNAERGEYGPGDIEALVAERLRLARMFTPHLTERVRPNGRVLRIRGQPLANLGFVTLYSDITEQRYFETLIRQQNTDLERRVLQRTAELRASNQRLLETMRDNEAMTRALRRSEEQLRLVTDSVPALIGYFDPQRTYRFANRGYAEWFGLPTHDPATLSRQAMLGSEVNERIGPDVERALAGEQVTFEHELTLGGQRQVVVQTSLIPDLGADGQVAGCFELSFDVTEQKRAQAVLLRTQKMEALGQLTSGLSHDFNNILTVVIGHLELLHAQRPDDPLTPSLLAPALDAARRGAELLKGLLSFARQQPLRAMAVEIGALLQSVQRLVRHALPDSFALVLAAPAEPVHALVDAHQLENALLNLILNARDATHACGQVLLRARAQQLDAPMAARLQVPIGDYVLLEAVDNGGGMDAATLARVFEPFFTTKPAGSGTGLGLAMVYGFVRQSGGAIQIDSQPGTGTQVSLWLPATEGLLATEPDHPLSAHPPASPRGLALLVEDDAEVRRVMRHHLRELGYTVLEADNGTEALAMLTQVPDIVLLLSDIVMPGPVDGRALARAARQQGHPATLVLMSGDTTDLADLPGIPLLAKPFSRLQLAALLPP